MSLYRVGRIWYLDIPTSKGRLRSSTGIADKRQAQEYHDKVKTDLWRHEKLGERLPVTWGEAVKKWMSVQSRGLPDRYRIASFGLSLTTVLPLPPETVTKLLSRNSTAVSSGSWNRSLALVVAIHNAVGVEPPKVERRQMPPGRTRWLSKQEWAILLKALKTESELLSQAARFAIATGLRENNVLNLRWDQVHGSTVFLEAAETKQKTPHGIPLTNEAKRVLRERRGFHKVYVFAHPESGKPFYKASNRAWYSAVRKAGLKGLRWHDLRHTWAAWAVQSGVPLEVIMRLGGWKTYSMVLRYAHLGAGQLAREAAKIKPVSRDYDRNMS